MTPQLVAGIAALKVEFAPEFARGEIVHLGVTNCRRKNNLPNSAWSEHSWSNAVDVMLKDWPGRKALGDRIAKWMRSRPDLWSEVFWWVASHYDHVHGTAKPRRNYNNKQIPPCAGGGDDDEMTPAQMAELKADIAGVPIGVWAALPGGPTVGSAWQTLIRTKANTDRLVTMLASALQLAELTEDELELIAVAVADEIASRGGE